MSRRTAALLLAGLALSVVPMAWQDFTIGTRYVQSDAGVNVMAGLRILEGQIPYRDWHVVWPPLGPLSMAASFSLFGVSMVAAKVPLALLSAGAIPMAYRWLRPHASRGGAVAGAASLWAITPVLMRLPYATNLALLPALLCLQQIGRLSGRRVAGPALGAGAACGLAFGLKHNVGILLAVMLVATLSSRMAAPGRAVGAAIALSFLAILGAELPVPGRTYVLTLLPVALLAVAGACRPPSALPTATALRALALAAAGGAAVTVPWAAWLARAGALGLFLEQGQLRRSSSGAAWGAGYGLLLPPLPAHRAVVWILGALGAAALACALRGRRGSWGAAVLCLALCAAAVMDGGVYAFELSSQYAGAGLLLAIVAWRHHPQALAAAAAASWVSVLSYPAMSINHTTVGLAPAVALGTALGWDAAGRRGRGGRGALLLVVVLLTAHGWLEWAETVVARGPRGPVPRPLARVPGARGGTWVPVHVAAGYVELLDALDRRSPAGAPLVAWPALGLANFLSARPNPTSLDYYWPGYLDGAFQARLLRELHRSRPPAIVLGTARDQIYGIGGMWREAPGLARGVMTAYRPTDRVGDILVLSRPEDPAGP